MLISVEHDLREVGASVRMRALAHMIESDAKLGLDEVLDATEHGRIVEFHPHIGAAVLDRERAIRSVGGNVTRLRHFFAVHLLGLRLVPPLQPGRRTFRVG
jgi:hypothetical protein